jgi:hypothetical protein
LHGIEPPGKGATREGSALFLLHVFLQRESIMINRFSVLLGRVAVAVTAKTVWWVSEIIWDHTIAFIRRQLARMRPLYVAAGGRLRAMWTMLMNVNDCAIVNLTTGELYLGAGA